MRKEIELIVWLAIIVFTLSVILGGWEVAHGHYYRPGDDFGYNLGLTGALMMLALLIYPLRKNFRFMQRWGQIKYWFSLHMMFGIFGPLLVLFHSTFHIHSLNALVAFTSMCIVAGSGLIGRFAYSQIHRGLYGSKLSLNDLQGELFGSEHEAESKLANFPKVLMLLHQFHEYAINAKLGFVGRTVRFLMLPVFRLTCGVRCSFYLPKHSREARALNQLVLDYLYGVERLSQFAVFERIFALWHVIHIPLVYLLVITAIWHVVAVHMY